MNEKIRNEQGMTLIEVIVSMLIGVTVIAAAFTALTTTQKANRANGMVVETQQNIRVAMDLISGDIKNAGFGSSGIVGNCNAVVGGTTQVAPIVPADKTVGGNDNGPDSISMIVPSTGSSPAWTLANDTAIGFNQITLQVGAAAAMSAAGLTPGVNNNDLISIGGLSSVRVLSIAGDTLTLGSTVAAPARFLVNTPVYLMQCVTYQVIQAPDVNNVCGGTAPCLVRGVTTAASPRQCNVAGSPCIPIVDGIEDLQIAYACDGCNNAINGGAPNGIIDDQGTIDNTFNDADWVSNNTWTADPFFTANKIRLAKVGLVARQTQKDLGIGESMQSAQVSSGTVNVSMNNDHVIAIAGTETGFRRRTLVRAIQTRNVGLW
ncbi:MAG TPA: PilW family protein [Nitrospiraceae bacterium]|nr:PilW family protein [Nitrospiraceae bacterium]